MGASPVSAGRESRAVLSTGCRSAWRPSGGRRRSRAARSRPCRRATAPRPPTWPGCSGRTSSPVARFAGAFFAGALRAVPEGQVEQESVSTSSSPVVFVGGGLRCGRLPRRGVLAVAFFAVVFFAVVFAVASSPWSSSRSPRGRSLSGCPLRGTPLRGALPRGRRPRGCLPGRAVRRDVTTRRGGVPASWTGAATASEDVGRIRTCRARGGAGELVDLAGERRHRGAEMLDITNDTGHVEAGHRGLDLAADEADELLRFVSAAVSSSSASRLASLATFLLEASAPERVGGSRAASLARLRVRSPSPDASSTYPGWSAWPWVLLGASGRSAVRAGHATGARPSWAAPRPRGEGLDTAVGGPGVPGFVHGRDRLARLRRPVLTGSPCSARRSGATNVGPTLRWGLRQARRSSTPVRTSNESIPAATAPSMSVSSRSPRRGCDGRPAPAGPHRGGRAGVRACRRRGRERDPRRSAPRQPGSRSRSDAPVGREGGVGVRGDPQCPALDGIRRLRQVGRGHGRSVALQHGGHRRVRCWSRRRQNREEPSISQCRGHADAADGEDRAACGEAVSENPGTGLRLVATADGSHAEPSSAGAARRPPVRARRCSVA